MQFFFWHFLISQSFRIIGKQYASMDFDHGPRSLFKGFGILTENSVLKEGLIYLFTFQFLQKGFFTPKCFFKSKNVYLDDPIKLKCSSKS
jgi:hypothetical protein